MRKWLAGRVIWLLRVLLGAELEGPELDSCRCPVCQNFFWVVEAQIEPPTFCAYCGTRFSGHINITGADFDLGN